MNKDNFKLDEKIKTKFKLFLGLRTQEEDEKIFEKVYELIFDEMLKFLSENLSEKDIQKLTDELEKSSLEIAKEDKSIKALLKYLSKIENYRFKLDKRLDYFLNNLLYSSIENRHLKNEN